MYKEGIVPKSRRSYIFDLLMESTFAASEIVSNNFGEMDASRFGASNSSAVLSEWSCELSPPVLAQLPHGLRNGNVAWGILGEFTLDSSLMCERLFKIPRFIPRTNSSRADQAYADQRVSLFFKTFATPNHRSDRSYPTFNPKVPGSRPERPTEWSWTFTLVDPKGRRAMYGKSKISELIAVSQTTLTLIQ